MAWSDIFLPSSAQSADDAAANLARQQELLRQRLEARQAAGTITPEQVDNYQAGLMLALDDQNAAAAQGFQEGAAEGLNNVLNFPGQVVDTAGKGLSQVLWGVIKGIPWWAWFVAAGALFVWMGGLTLLKGRLARQ